MERRKFLSQATMASLLLQVPVFLKAADQNETFPVPGSDKFDLAELSVDKLQKLYSSKKITAEKITQLYLDRIHAIDKKGPALNAVIEINPDAILIARQMDAERITGKVRSKLHGIPVLIKDNISTADKMQTTAGSIALAGYKATQDAFIIKKLRDSGAVLLGKTNLSEWANFRSSNSCSGWSSRGGQTKNPYILDHNPCGSSSGSGVAVSANLCMMAIGTETDGSITCPAAVNGIVGIKPTVGLLSRSGIIPISATQDTAGPMARTVTDAAILLGLLAGPDPRDPSPAFELIKTEKDYTSFLNPDVLKGKRIGIEKKLPGKNKYIHRLQSDALNILRSKGAEVIEIDYLDTINKAGDAEFEVLQYEFKDGLNKFLKDAGAPVRSLQDVIDFNKQHEDAAMPYFKQEILEGSQKKGSLDDNAYKDAFKKSHTDSCKLINDVMNNNRLDAICGITMGPACSIDLIYGDRWGDVSLTMPAAITGYPHITVPAGTCYDLPVGFSFFGRAFSEGTLIGLAYAFEQATKLRKEPAYKKAFLP